MANAGQFLDRFGLWSDWGKFCNESRPWNWSARFVKYVAKVLSKWMTSLIDGRLFVN